MKYILVGGSIKSNLIRIGPVLTWSMMELIVGVTGLAVALLMNLVW